MGCDYLDCVGRFLEMSAADKPTMSVCHVLRDDPDLGEAVPDAVRETAAEECIAPVVRMRVGRWNGEQRDLDPGAIGLLVLEGMLIRRVGVDGRFGAELLGAGDLLRPWQNQQGQLTLAHTTGWRVLQPARLALLDARVAHRFARYPEITGRLVGRALERSRNLALNMAIVHQARVDTRLQMLFWHLANRWGRVVPQGVLVPLHLTHSVLAELVAARRPTVSSAMSDLAKGKLVLPVDSGWILSGEPPGELLAPLASDEMPPVLDGVAPVGDDIRTVS